MSELPGLYAESANDTRIEEYLEESSIQDDYKKIKHENEYYQQELHVLRLKLKASDAFGKELQEANEALEQSLVRCTAKTKNMLAEREEKYRAEKKEYENHIANLETNALQNIQKIKELHEELRKYKNLTNKQSYYPIFMEDNLTPYKERIKELTKLLQDEEKKGEKLEEGLANMEAQCQELQDILKITKQQLAEKNEALENTREELATCRIELESLKITPASDTCKGNSLFAEVEDRRQMLLDQMKEAQDKYHEAKRALNTRMSEIKILRAEKTAMARKWKDDAIDTLQEKTDLLNKYISRIFELENKLKAEIKRNDQAEEMQSTDDSFNYAQSLLATKRKELRQLNEKIEKQAMQMLVQEEANHNISIQLRYWRSKAMFLEAQILTIKAQSEAEEINTDNNKTLLEAIENCKIANNANFEQTYDDLKVTCNNLLSKDNTSQQNSTEVSEKPLTDTDVNRQTEFNRKILHFAMDTKDTEHKPLKKQPKQRNYPIISIVNDS